MRLMYTVTVLFLIFTVHVSAQSVAEETGCTKAGCHLGLVNLRYTHAPVKDDCSTCHVTNEKEHPGEKGPEFSLESSMPELCLLCHELGDSDVHVHVPVSEGMCNECHNEHGSQNAKLLKQAFICENCHEMDMDKAFIHGPVAGKMCIACHDPHMSAEENLLKTTVKDICLYCHEAKKENQNMPSVHPPYLENCMDCHQPHYSDAKYLLDQDVPEMCFACHEQVEVDLANKSEIHGPFQKDGKCYLCHNAHVSQYDHLLQDQEQKLCYTCHNQEIMKGDRQVKDIQSRVGEGMLVHVPLSDSGCSVCHIAHTPDHTYLLSEAFPRGSYTEGKVDNFAHCFDCHDTGLFTDAETGEATEFRNGRTNLHYVHVNREKARSCTTCHDTHGARNPHLIASEVPFGKWRMPMTFRHFDDGGSCLTGCHKELSYHRTP